MILTEEQEQIRDMAREFAQDVLAPGAAQRDRDLGRLVAVRGVDDPEAPAAPSPSNARAFILPYQLYEYPHHQSGPYSFILFSVAFIIC